MTVLDQIPNYDERKLEAIEQNARRLTETGTEEQKTHANTVLLAIDAEKRRRRDKAKGFIGTHTVISGLTKRCNTCGVEKPLDINYFGRANVGRAWQPHCRECGKQRSKEHRENNKEKLALYDNARRERDKRPTFSDNQKRELWQHQAGICLCCATPILEADISQSQVDHRVPLVREGSHDSSNLALAHPRCNTDKHKKTLAEHWLWRYQAGFDTAPLTEITIRTIIEESRRGRKSDKR